MLIDWFTVGAQALNFLILVGLLRRFLYRPILNAIDAREKMISTEMAEAAAQKDGAKKERDEFQRKNEEFERQRAGLLSKARDEAKAERQRLLDEARKTADGLSAQRQEELAGESHNLNQAIARRVQQEVFAIARRSLADLASVSLEERMVEVFVRRLHELQGSPKESLVIAIKAAGGIAVIGSAFVLPMNQQAAIQRAAGEIFPDIHLRFEPMPDLVSGIELTAGGQSVGWSITEYLETLEQSVAALQKNHEKSRANGKQTVNPSPSPQASAEILLPSQSPPAPEMAVATLAS